MKKKIFITGGTGTLGINLIKKLSNTDHKLFVIYRDKKKLLPFKNLKKKINFIKLNLSNKVLLNKTINKINPHIVFHLASSYFNPPDLDLEDHLEANFYNTFNLVNALKKTQIEKFIFSGSAAVYENGKNLSEKSKYSFVNNYGFSKLLCSKLLITYKNLYNFPYIELRFFSFYGDWEKSTRLVKSAITSGLKKKIFYLFSENQIRDYIYIDDAVNALISVSKKKNIFGIFNICSAKKHSTHKLVKIIYKKLNLKKEMVKTKYNLKTNIIKEMVGNNLKAKKILKWQPMFSIDDGLNQAIRSIKNH